MQPNYFIQWRRHPHPSERCTNMGRKRGAAAVSLGGSRMHIHNDLRSGNLFRIPSRFPEHISPIFFFFLFPIILIQFCALIRPFYWLLLPSVRLSVCMSESMYICYMYIWAPIAPRSISPVSLLEYQHWQRYINMRARCVRPRKKDKEERGRPAEICSIYFVPLRKFSESRNENKIAIKCAPRSDRTYTIWS